MENRSRRSIIHLIIIPEEKQIKEREEAIFEKIMEDYFL